VRLCDRKHYNPSACKYDEYRKMASEAVTACGGKYLAQAWYSSEEYRESRTLRQAIAVSVMYAVQGV